MSRIGYRHCDPRFPFLWSNADQPAARWHRAGAGPAYYFADTPVGAWAEFLRHEEIRDADDLQGVRRSLWAVELPDAGYATPKVPPTTLTGGPETYAACQAEAARLRESGAQRISARSAALRDGAARGWIADPAEHPAARPKDGVVRVVYGNTSDLVGWPAVEAGAPSSRILPLVRHY